MKLLKILSLIAVGGSAMFSYMALSQTESVSCTWNTTSTSSGANGANITQACKENGTNLIATRYFEYRNGQPEKCTLSLQSGITSTGSCQSPSFYREVQSSSSSSSSSGGSSCNSGKYIGNVCQSYYDADNNFDYAIEQECGAGCPAYTVNAGYTEQCPPPGRWHQVDDPEVAVYCQ